MSNESAETQVSVKKISVENEQEWHIARYIREEVFVKEQNVPLEDEYDEFDLTATHFLAFHRDQAVGTCRWRYTENGVKLERFAVLDLARGNGIGSVLVAATLKDVNKNIASEGKIIYINSQVSAVGLYEKYGFEREGEQFDECGIWHYKMVKKK
jgi:predicted GNAT family N-acyltransferase